jgi:UDP-N-acetylglucosamine--N-acetylmuramyl-(pentapeptide) pyrophosphoryl-undecaprenol N-acetylglucosamine transferase
MIADEAMLGLGDPTDGPLMEAIRSLVSDHERRSDMAAQSRALARPAAAAHLAQAVLDLAR